MIILDTLYTLEWFPHFSIFKWITPAKSLLPLRVTYLKILRIKTERSFIPADLPHYNIHLWSLCKLQINLSFGVYIFFVIIISIYQEFQSKISFLFWSLSNLTFHYMPTNDKSETNNNTDKITRWILDRVSPGSRSLSSYFCAVVWDVRKMKILWGWF